MLEHISPSSVDLIATDPPYGVNILGEKWDKILPDKKIWENCFQVAKPGSFLLAMGSTRMYHRLACDIEDSGFKIKDCLVWAYVTGFPHGKDISKEIDKKKNLSRKVIGKRIHPTLKNKPKVKSRAYLVNSIDSDENNESWEITEPACEESKKWEGWNTQLKPAYEPILVAQKPIEGTYAENVLKYNVGGINIDECRIPYKDEEDMKSVASFEGFTDGDFGNKKFFSANSNNKKQVNVNPSGRYPSNIMCFDDIFDGQYNKFFMIPKPSGMEKYDSSHSTVKPVKLFYHLIKMFSPRPSVVGSDVFILDPFMGSATTGVACYELDRSFVGFEIDPIFFKEARKRLNFISRTKNIFES
jgi:site-specific DNA-methyltransferase (adenine-specific)